MSSSNREEQEDELLALSEILPPATLTLDKPALAKLSGTIQVRRGVAVISLFYQRQKLYSCSVIPPPLKQK